MRTTCSRGPCGERLAVEQLHDQVLDAVLPADVVAVCDVVPEYHPQTGTVLAMAPRGGALHPDADAKDSLREELRRQLAQGIGAGHRDSRRHQQRLPHRDSMLTARAGGRGEFAHCCVMGACLGLLRDCRLVVGVLVHELHPRNGQLRADELLRRATGGHPGVREVSVIGRPHPDWGEVVVAYVAGEAAEPLGLPERPAAPGLVEERAPPEDEPLAHQRVPRDHLEVRAHDRRP